MVTRLTFISGDNDNWWWSEWPPNISFVLTLNINWNCQTHVHKQMWVNTVGKSKIRCHPVSNKSIHKEEWQYANEFPTRVTEERRRSVLWWVDWTSAISFRSLSAISFHSSRLFFSWSTSAFSCLMTELCDLLMYSSMHVLTSSFKCWRMHNQGLWLLRKIAIFL